MTNPPDGEYVRRMARAEELKALAAHAGNPATRVFYLQLAAAFRHLAEAQSRQSATPRLDNRQQR